MPVEQGAVIIEVKKLLIGVAVEFGKRLAGRRMTATPIIH
jgi:hypothetical protein